VKNNPRSGRELLILGVYLASSGYPNVKYRIEDLKQHYPLWSEINFPMWREQDLGTIGRYGALKSIVRALYAHTFSIVAILYSRRKPVIYIPYPAIFICFIISFLPTFLRPKHLVIDMFISIYDSAIIDRKLFGEGHVFSKLLLWVEGRAVKAADVIITDTELNSDYYADLFSVRRDKFTAIPLSTDESGLLVESSPSDNERIEVVFVGTLVPLHGIKTIVEAIGLLVAEKQIHFTIIGDGQDRSELDLYSSENPEQVRWIKSWQNETEIGKYISESDICLGVFGGGDKTQRVCPFKLYLYMSYGKSIITANTKCMRAMFRNNAQPPVSLVSSDTPEELAMAIQTLSSNESTRKRLEYLSRVFYRESMANKIGMSKLIQKLNND